MSNYTAEEVKRMTYEQYRRLHDLAQKLRCPKCGAPSGSGCAFLPGLAFVMASYHMERVLLVPRPEKP